MYIVRGAMKNIHSHVTYLVGESRQGSDGRVLLQTNIGRHMTPYRIRIQQLQAGSTAATGPQTISALAQVALSLSLLDRKEGRGQPVTTAPPP